MEDTILTSVKREQFTTQYADVFKGDERWQAIVAPSGDQYAWDANSTYVQNPPYFDGMTMTPPGIRPINGAKGARHVRRFHHHRPHLARRFHRRRRPAGKYLNALGVEKKDFNSYGARRGNHEVMMRGTFANIRLKERTDGWQGRLVDGHRARCRTGSDLRCVDGPSGAGVPQIVIAGKEYGTGSSRDWAAKAPCSSACAP